MTIREMLVYGERRLQQADVPEAKVSAWYLFAYITGMTKSSFFCGQRKKQKKAG